MIISLMASCAVTAYTSCFFVPFHFLKKQGICKCSVCRCTQLVARHSVHGCINNSVKSSWTAQVRRKERIPVNSEYAWLRCKLTVEQHTPTVFCRQVWSNKYVKPMNTWAVPLQFQNFFYVLTRSISPSASSFCQFRGNPSTQSVALTWISSLYKNMRLATCSKECSFVIHRQKDQY
jgi:hypothetical protein